MNLIIPVNWLREYLKTQINNNTIADYVSRSGPSIEKVTKIKKDYIFDTEITSNRPDTMSIWGFARETQAILTENGIKTGLINPTGLNLSLEPDISKKLVLKVVIKNNNLCPRFTAIILDNIVIRSSPAFIKKNLELCGIRPINNIVDITNYLMLELGQPMHAFDWDKIIDHKMILRKSQKGEKIKTLDGQIRKLPVGSIVIEDKNRLIDLCGIMGGANTQINKRTKRVILFVQAYNSKSIRRTTQALAFRTEAASRFEKGVDLEGILPALSRAVYMAKKTADAKIASEVIDIYPAKYQPKPVKLKITTLNRYLGFEISWTKIVDILRTLGFKAEIQNQILSAIPPSWRIGDITDDVDLIEEIARIYGYQKLPEKLPYGHIPIPNESNLGKAIELKKILKYLGLTEVISYSIISKELLQLTGRRTAETVELANPLTSEWQYMRPTLIISLAQIIAENQNLRDNIKIFEVANTYIKNGNDLPRQDLMLTLALYNSDFYQIKEILDNSLKTLNYQSKWQLSNAPNKLIDNNQAAVIKVNEKTVGQAGILHSNIADFFAIKTKTCVAEINLSTLYSLPSKIRNYKAVSKYPPVIEDISAIFADTIPIGKIVANIKKAAMPLVKKIEIIDVFVNEKIGKDKKSVTFRLTYQRADRTPTQEEVTAVLEKISAQLTKTFHAQIRG